MLTGNELDSLIHENSDRHSQAFLRHSYNKRKRDLSSRLQHSVVFGCILELIVKNFDDFFQNTILIFEWIHDNGIKGFVLNENYGSFSQKPQKWEYELFKRLVANDRLTHVSYNKFD
jgi:hypothetical protein